VCAAADCRRAWFVDRRRKAHERLEGEARELRRRGAVALGIREPDAYTLAVIPSTTAELSELPEHRRRAFRERLASLLREAAERREAGGGGGDVGDAPPEAPTPELGAVLGGACATCKGFCCRSGGDRAWLTAGTMLQYMDAHPDRSPDDVLEAYAAYVPAETVRGSCVYHQADGCALPPAMRSDICKRYFCDGLQRFRRELSGEGPVRGFFAAAGADGIESGAFIDATATRAVPAP
jgi:hypothetical protein